MNHAGQNKRTHFPVEVLGRSLVKADSAQMKTTYQFHDLATLYGHESYAKNNEYI